MSNSASKPIAVVTGASAGIGAVYADRLAARGYDLVLVARRAERLKTLSAKLSRAYGAKIEVIGADLTKEEGLARVEKVLATNTAITLLVNNAGNGTLGSTINTSDENAASTIALNITALTRLTRAALPAFLSRDAGAIINIASVMALHSLPITSLYSGTKGYVVNFSRGLQEELAGTGVRLQLVLPAATATEFYEFAGMPLSAFDPAVVMTAEDMVDAALAGFDQGEAITLPSVHDRALWETYDAARATLFAATQTGEPAPRYQAA
ncbi:SDR family NAD(P)-dependent oxidoreductase [Mesorhizobium delmotii]|uniref:NADP-dependent 3-hydroxy acid dehydrogenase YdfG n=1 Tax=Mesorhizobium delmotii TaxID=1631247 RepID=A0A2P9ATA3_9HYPH|nr:SDR family oxidoreductase [Mesorhizobium delmotii]SJM34397.1 AraC family transcriptional regulator [Mesorhizobium delmotii]